MKTEILSYKEVMQLIEEDFTEINKLKDIKFKKFIGDFEFLLDIAAQERSIRKTLDEKFESLDEDLKMLLECMAAYSRIRKQIKS